jgi:prophage regulatory protein
MAEPMQHFLRLKQVKLQTGLSRSWIYEAIRRGDFPAPISIGARAVAWTEQSIAEWQTMRIQNSCKVGRHGK